MKFEAYLACLEILRSKSMLDENTAKQLYGITFKKHRQPGSTPLDRPRKYTDEVLATWDWDKPERAISMEHGISITTVRSLRRRIGKPAVPAPGSRDGLLAQRRAWDWTQKDYTLSKIHNLSRERVRQIRAQLGMPATNEQKRMAQSVQKQKFIEWLNGRKEIVFLEALRQTGSNADAIKKWCFELGVRRELSPRSVQGKWPWRLVNWPLPNIQIEKAWGMGKNLPATHRNITGGLPAIDRDPTTLQTRLAEEKTKAKQWLSKGAQPELHDL